MQTILYPCQKDQQPNNALSECGALIRKGGLVAFPTETVYGLGANALDSEAVAKIFMVKNRPTNNPLIAHISDISMLSGLVKEFPKELQALTDEFWPGPLTLVLPRTEQVPKIVSAGLDTVAVRCPAHPIALGLIQAAGVPIVAPSANLSGRPSPTCFAHCKEDLWGKVDAILDGGSCEIGLESTVLLPLGGKRLKLLRPGGITPAMLEALGFSVEIDPAVLAPVKEGQKVSSPGMLHRHYAPKAPLTIIKGNAKAVCRALKKREKEGVWMLVFDEYLHQFKNAISFGSEKDPRSQSQALFKALRDFDGLCCKEIFAMMPSKEGEGLAICNRLLRAASFRIIEAKSIIGLTGFSGSGKTTLSALFAKAGYLALDCDKIVHEEVYKDPFVLKKIAEAFGEECIKGGALDRAILRQKTMGNPQETRRLNQTVLPLIAAHIEKILEENKDRHILLDAPTLFESGLDARCDQIISVVAPKEAAIRRIMERDHLSLSDAERRLSSQKEAEYYSSRSDFTIINDGLEEEFRQKAKALLEVIHG